MEDDRPRMQVKELAFILVWMSLETCCEIRRQVQVVSLGSTENISRGVWRWGRGGR